MRLVLGIDLGTTYFKTGVFDPDGVCRGLVRSPVPKVESAECCELDPDRFWETLRDATREALRLAGGATGDLQAIGYASQANSFLLLDADDQPLTPLILWPDRRGEGRAPEFVALFNRPDFLAVTGLGFEPMAEFAASKLCWLRRNEPRRWAAAHALQTISDYLIYSLTGRRVGDASTTALTGLMELETLAWWPAALDQLALDRRLLSQPLRTGHPAGRVTERGAGRLGVPVGAPVAAGGLDHHIAALGAGVGRLASLSESTGTVLACLGLASRPDPRPACCVGPAHLPGQYYRLGSGPDGGAGLDWYQRHFAPELTVAELLHLAGEAPAGCRGVRAARAIQNRSPDEAFNRPPAQRSHGDCVRAILEMQADALGELIDRLGMGDCRAILATGGAARSDLWLQVKADRLGRTIIRVNTAEPACRGAAMLAACAAGWFSGLDAAGAAWVRAERVFEPSTSP